MQFFRSQHENNFEACESTGEEQLPHLDLSYFSLGLHPIGDKEV